MSIIVITPDDGEQAGGGPIRCRIIEDGSVTTIFRTRPRQVRFVGHSAAVGGVVFHIHNCAFPSSGLYWAEVLFAGAVVARQRLFVRG